MEKLSIPIPSDLKVRFRSRPNRFVVNVLTDDGRELICHLHDPGRLKEILVPGNDLLLRYAKKEGRKTDWDVVAGNVNDTWVLINSSYHRLISQSILEDPLVSPFGKHSQIVPEVKVGSSRLDYRLTTKKGENVYIEVKGCSLTLVRKAMFPDAPTQRGVRHLKELIHLKKEGNRSAVMILVLGPEAECFAPKEDTDPDFARTFYDALENGVEVYPLSFQFDGEFLKYKGMIPVCERIS